MYKNNTNYNIQSGQLSWKHARLVLGRSGVQISPSPIEFSIEGRLRERFYAVRHKIRLRRIEFEIMKWYIQSIHCRLDIAQKTYFTLVRGEKRRCEVTLQRNVIKGKIVKHDFC